MISVFYNGDAADLRLVNQKLSFGIECLISVGGNISVLSPSFKLMDSLSGQWVFKAEYKYLKCLEDI